MSLAYRRMYIDLPTETADAFKVLAAQRGKSQRALLAELVERETTAANKRTTTTRKKRTSKRKK